MQLFQTFRLKQGQPYPTGTAEAQGGSNKPVKPDVKRRGFGNSTAGNKYVETRSGEKPSKQSAKQSKSKPTGHKTGTVRPTFHPNQHSTLLGQRPTR